MTEASGPERDLDPLRPARPRRTREPEVANASTVWELSGRVEELQEVVWSMVDILTELRDGLGEVVRELGRLRATQTGTRDHATLNGILGEVRAELATIGKRVSEVLPLVSESVAGQAQPEVLRHLEEILATLDDHEGRIDRIAETLAAFTATNRQADLLAALERLSDRIPPVTSAKPASRKPTKKALSSTPAKAGAASDGQPRKRTSRRAVRADESPGRAAKG